MSVFYYKYYNNIRYLYLFANGACFKIPCLGIISVTLIYCLKKYYNWKYKK